MDPKRIFITGTAGFIGFHLADLLLRRGHQIAGYDGLTDYYDVSLKQQRHALLKIHDGFSSTEAMLEDETKLQDAVLSFQPEVIVHLAAQAGVRYSIDNPRAYLDSNIIGTFNVMEVARAGRVSHLLMASTSSVYGANTQMPFTETERVATPLTFYAASKLANEAMGHSEAFEKLYTQYEAEGKFRKQIKARELWAAIIEAQIETGNPYMLFKDAANSKSNQQNLGTIKSSNLCTEIIEYTSADEVAVCNLASIALPRFVDEKTGTFDHNKLFEITYVATKNLNKIIDRNYYPIPEARKSNMRHRPIGLGVQGLADAFILMRYSFESEEAKRLNSEIFETIYYAALTASKDLAKIEGAYETYEGSPISKGVFQQDMWNVTPSSRWEWDTLREEIMKYGVRNSLLLAPMPTASTSQILGNNECFEPYTSNIYTRRVIKRRVCSSKQTFITRLSKIRYVE